MRRCTSVLCPSMGLAAIGRIDTAARDTPLSPFVGRDAGTIGDLLLPVVEQRRPVLGLASAVPGVSAAGGTGGRAKALPPQSGRSAP
jgi:hypothetical protein